MFYKDGEKNKIEPGFIGLSYSKYPYRVDYSCEELDNYSTEVKTRNSRENTQRPYGDR